MSTHLVLGAALALVGSINVCAQGTATPVVPDLTATNGNANGRPGRVLACWPA
jgi:hypothetical protein